MNAACLQAAKTSLPRRRTATPTKAKPTPGLLTPPTPTRLSIQDPTQSLTARARTKTLLRRTRSDREEYVAARSLAGSARTIVKLYLWALALARHRALSLRNFGRPRCPGLRWGSLLRNLLLDGGQARFTLGLKLVPLTISVAATLTPTLLLTSGRAPITPRRLPRLPLPGLLPASRAAIPSLRPFRTKGPFTTLQQATPRTAKALMWTIRDGILKWAQGRSVNSRRSSLEVE